MVEIPQVLHVAPYLVGESLREETAHMSCEAAHTLEVRARGWISSPAGASAGRASGSSWNLTNELMVSMRSRKRVPTESNDWMRIAMLLKMRALQTCPQHRGVDAVSRPVAFQATHTTTALVATGWAVERVGGGVGSGQRQHCGTHRSKQLDTHRKRALEVRLWGDVAVARRRERDESPVHGSRIPVV